MHSKFPNTIGPRVLCNTPRVTFCCVIVTMIVMVVTCEPFSYQVIFQALSVSITYILCTHNQSSDSHDYAIWYMHTPSLFSPIPAAYLPKDIPQSPSGAIRQEPMTSISQSTAPRSSSSHKTLSLLQLPVKRERELLSSCETEPQPKTCKKIPVIDNSSENQTQSSPMDQDVSLSSSIEIVDPESEDDSVIDLTQDT